MSDRLLHRKVLEELEWDPSVNAVRIGVSVENGVVRLTGRVPDFAQRWAAERAAKRVKGVRGLVDELQVSTFIEPLTDQSIAERATNLLAWNATVPKGAVQVMVSDGHLILAGAVDWAFQRTAAEQLVRGLYGVRDLTNRIKVHNMVKVGDVKERIESALKRQGYGKANGVSVVVAGGTVRLSGQVATLREREAIERAAWHAPGVTAVEDRLTVGP